MRCLNIEEKGKDKAEAKKGKMSNRLIWKCRYAARKQAIHTGKDMERRGKGGETEKTK